MAFDLGGKCPICKRWFKDDACPHSVADAEERIENDRIRSITGEGVQWFARTKLIARVGPFDKQWQAAAAIMTIDGNPADGAFVWPEPMAKKRGREG